MTVELKKNALLEKYAAELEQDVVLDKAMLDEKMLMVPGLKAKYVTRLYRHKNEYAELSKAYHRAKEAAMDSISKTSQVRLTKISLEKAADDHPSVREVAQDMANLAVVVEFLERIATTISGIGFDIKNLIEWTKLELT